MTKGKFKFFTLEMKKTSNRESTRKWRLKKEIKKRLENEKLREALKNEKLRFLLNEINK